MELPELKEVINKALKRCQRKLNEQPEIVLSEADFERLVSWSIMKQLKQDNYREPAPGDYIVHTQLSHYPDGEIRKNVRPNIRPDVILLTKEGMEKADKTKGFKYNDDSFTLELKYLREGNSTTIVERDFKKRNRLYKKSWLYVIVLIETDLESDYNDKKKRIEKMRDDILKDPKYKNSVFSFTIWKTKVHDFVRGNE